MKAMAFRAVLLVVLALYATSAFADSVKGAFTLEGKPPFKPVEVVAFRTPEKDTMVMLTAKPLDRARIAKSSDPEATAVNDEAVRAAGFLAFVVSADGQVSMNAKVGGVQYLDGTRLELVATCTANTPGHVACSVKSKKLVKYKNEPGWTLDVAFDSAVLAPPAK